MKKEDFVCNTGLYAYSACSFIQMVNKFSSRVILEFKERRLIVTSLLSLLALGIGNGEKISIIVEGLDEDNAMSAIKNFFEIHT